MRLLFRCVVVVFGLASILIFAVYLHSANNRIFYKLSTYQSELNQFKQQLWQKQLRVESLLNPASISQRIED